MPVRGFVWGVYVSDDAHSYALRVDADYALEIGRGWSFPAPAGTSVYPRGWIPRRVEGVDSAGNIRYAIVAQVGANLWTGVATTFSINASDETAHVCTVTRRHQERFSARP